MENCNKLVEKYDEVIVGEAAWELGNLLRGKYDRNEFDSSLDYLKFVLNFRNSIIEKGE